ncbi:DUF397 domain-containing protein (plasmid) [Streptomyces europaeiscabiei]|uniref:DUF397 domain-containing protein n=1 Tax=Streptomyces europaeiscabiei TaxID=146819 RepID=UPI002E824815|nr:DUF397 domain-containing protein [Streptomyces europaeiscabiei]WUD38830.1 DUF397 domain-containing protein [Streptomyces europaeiscabiei]
MTHLSKEWRKSTYCNDTFSACVEVRHSTAGVDIRDSKDTSIPPFSMTSEAWRLFVAGVSQSSL